MRKITPYKNKKNALATLDNGVRFYNLLTQASDGEISSAELAKAAGVYSDRQQMILNLEMSICELDLASEEDIVRQLSSDLKLSYNKYKPAYYTPKQALEKAQPAQSTIVTGVPKYIESSSDFTGFIMVPVMTGSVMTMIMIPIIDKYDVYEIRSKATDQSFLIAHARGQRKLEPVKTRFGGIIKELKAKKGEPQKHKIFLETLYYSENPA